MRFKFLPKIEPRINECFLILEELAKMKQERKNV